MAIVKDLPFPQSVVAHSALKHLQAKVQTVCRSFPKRFDTLEQWLDYRERTVSLLQRLLPIWELPEFPAYSNVTSLPLGKDLTLEALDVQFEDSFYIPVYLYRPRESNGPLPAVLVCPGYGCSTHSSDTADICIALAKHGMIAVSLDYDGGGERADRPDFETDINNVTAVAGLIGISNVGLRVMNNLAVLHYLKGRPDVDASRIGITGLCQGSIVTWFTAAVCEDFRAVAPLCGGTTYEAVALDYCNRQGGWSGTSPYVPGLLLETDMQFVAACIAPRPLLCQNNIVDLHWPYAGLESIRELCENVYALYPGGVKPGFALEHAAHAFCEPFIGNIVAFLSGQLGAACV